MTESSKEVETIDQLLADPRIINKKEAQNMTKTQAYMDKYQFTVAENQRFAEQILQVSAH